MSEKKNISNPIFHLGLTRTGTTFLQNRVFPFLENVNYVPLYLNNSYSQNPFMIKTYEDKTTLISNENICFFLHQDDIDKDSKFYAKSITIIKRLKKVFPNAGIIFCTRKKDSWLRSVYNNSVKNGYSHDFDYFLEHSRYIDIDDYIKTIKDLFDNVFIYSFEDFIKDKKKVVSDICGFIGTSVPGNINYSRMNISYSEKTIKKLVFFNKFFVSKQNPDGFLKLPNSLIFLFRKIILKINKKNDYHVQLKDYYK
jgi:hypothetical protein